MKPKFQKRFKKAYDISPGKRITVDGNRDAVVVYQAQNLSDGRVKTESTIFSGTEALRLLDALIEWRDMIPQKMLV